MFGHDSAGGENLEDDIFGSDNLAITPVTSIDITSVEIAENGNFILDFISPSGNVDIYRSTDLIDFGAPAGDLWTRSGDPQIT